MSIESVLYGILGPVFGTEFYPVTHPDPDGTEVATLYGIYLKVGGGVINKLDGTDDLTRPRMQISIYGIDSDAVIAKEAAVIAAMKTANDLSNAATDVNVDPFSITGALPNVMIGVPVDGYEKDTKRFVKHLEFYCWIRS